MKSDSTDEVRGEGTTCVRRRTQRDLDDCVRVLAQVHEHSGYPVDWPERPAAWLAQPAALGAWVAELDGRIAGHVSLCRGGEEDVAPGLWGARTGLGVEAAAVVGRLFVAPSARGRGIGAVLMARAVARAGRLGLHPVLDVAAGDTAAVALYERLGWRSLGAVPQRWGDREVVVRCYAAVLPPG
ncbi:GNAT family N-acetyltransferase [Streptomyces sp. NPDC018610]|uniref:GNAT family N-acetyltransferase n=1 Tax=Streptomyces sp. NPDC018610 TaxID=3365049 RepID=UPI00379D9371